MSRGQPIAARRILDAIQDEIERQTLRTAPSLTVRTLPENGHDPAAVQVEGILDVQAIAIVIADLVADR
jgi:hypothetical protein